MPESGEDIILVTGAGSGLGKGVAEAKAAFAKYAEARDKNFGFGFFLSDPEDVRFGYWGGLEAGAGVEPAPAETAVDEDDVIDELLPSS